MPKPVVLIDAGELVGLSGVNPGDVLKWDAGLGQWYAAEGGGTGTVTSVTAGAGLSGGTITTSGTISMPSVGSAGTYGSASSVAVVTTDAQGRVSNAVTTAIAITQSQVADLVTDLGLKADKSVTATAGAGLTGGGSLAANFSFALDTVGTAQTGLGSASKTLTISTDAYGRVTSLAEQAISGLPASAISIGQLALAQGGTGIDASGVTGGQVLVGGSGVLALQTIGGDATLASTGAVSVTKLQGNPVSATALGAPDAGKALVWSGSEWQASTIQGGGGGGGLTFFMNFAASSPYPMSPQFDENAGWDTGAITVANDANGTALGTFVTAVGSPAIEVIPAGLWDVNFYAQSSGGVNSIAVRVKVATLAGATQTVIATSDWVYLSDPSAIIQYSASVYVPVTDVALTDRVEIIFEGRRFVSPSQTITLHFGTGSITHAHTTINAPGGTGLVKVVDGFIQSPATLLVNADVDAAAAIEVSKLAAGTNDYVLTTVAGVPTWSALPSSGVTSLTGTANQVLVGGTSGSPQTGSLTLTLPQSIASTSSPTFAGLTVGSLGGLLRATAGVLAGGASVSLSTEVTGTLGVANGGTGLTSSGSAGNLLLSTGSGLQSRAMMGDATIASTGALTLKNTGTAGTYGSASVVPVIVTDAQGRVTSVTNTNISIGGSAFGSQAANTVLAAPNGSGGNPSFRSLVAADLPSLSSVYLPTAGGTMDASSKLTVATSTTAGAGFSLNSTLGVAPTSPQQGDIWTLSTGAVFISTASVSQQFITSAPVASVTIQPGSAAGARTISITAGTNTTASGAGGDFTIAAGQGGSGGTGGTLTLRGGALGSGGTNGAISIGATNTASVGIGAASITTTVAGTLAASTAAVDTNTTQVATTAYVIGQGYLKSATASSTYAPLASPTFTGTVTIPAGAIISGYAPLASPTFTGTPASVTASAGTNTTQIATTAFVTTAVANSSGAPYDVSGEAAGTLANGDEIWHFKATRAFTLSATAANHLAGAVTAPSGTCVITVYKNTTGTQVFTITYTASVTGVIGSVTNNSVAQGDLLFAKITSGPSTISNPYWTFYGTL
jgi:hypothetical protein